MDIVTYILCKKYAQSYTDEQIKIVSQGMTFKGSVPTLDDLPLEGNALGDLYIIESTNDEYVWASELSSGTIDNWQQIGKTDLSRFYTKTEIDSKESALEAKINKKVNSDTFNSTVVDLRSSDATLGELINVNKTDINNLKSSKQDKINDLAEIREGAALGKTAIQEHQDISHLATKTELNNKQDKLSVDTREDYTGITLKNGVIGVDHEIIATNEYVDANITDTMNFIIQERDNEHAGRVAGDNLLQAQIDTKQAAIEDLDEIRNGAALGATAIQEHQDISHLATKAELEEKQDKLGVNEANPTVDLNSLTIDNTIYRIAGDAKIGKTFTTNVTVGNLSAGTSITANMKVADILYRILYGEGPAPEVITLYYGGLDNIPVSITGLKAVEFDDDSKFMPAWEQNIVCGNIELEEGQYPTIAVPEKYVVTKWISKGFDFDIPHFHVNKDGYNIYYIDSLSYDEPEGINYVITVAEA